MAGREVESTVRIKPESPSKFVSETELSISNGYRPRATHFDVSRVATRGRVKGCGRNFSCDYRNQTT
jgi:hypothetical protein